MLAEWFGIRARIMRIGIERMLNDGYYKKLKKKKYRGSGMVGKIIPAGSKRIQAKLRG